MEGRTARQVGTLAEDDVLPAESREPVEDGGAADADDDDRPRTPFHANTLIRDLPALCRCSNDSMRTSLGFALTALLAAGLAGAPAQAAGGPSLREDAGLTGIATPTGFRYVAIGERNRTVLARISPHQRVVAVRFLAGRYTIAGVAYDGTATGLSADGKTLVLVRPRLAYPRAKTDFLIVSTPGLHVRDAVTLRGDFSLDAVSPDGSMLYFIQYLSPQDPTEYAVRALDTVAVEAHCIDLAGLAGRDDLVTLRLRLRGGSVAVVNDRRPLLVLDRATLQVSKPETGSLSQSGGSTPWGPIVAGAGALMAAGALSLTLLRRRRPAAT